MYSTCACVRFFKEAVTQAWVTTAEKMDVIESLSGMVTNMLEFPLVGFLGRLVPAGGSEAGQQVRSDTMAPVVAEIGVSGRSCSEHTFSLFPRGQSTSDCNRKSSSHAHMEDIFRGFVPPVFVLPFLSTVSTRRHGAIGPGCRMRDCKQLACARPVDDAERFIGVFYRF